MRLSAYQKCIDLIQQIQVEEYNYSDTIRVCKKEIVSDLLYALMDKARFDKGLMHCEFVDLYNYNKGIEND